VNFLERWISNALDCRVPSSFRRRSKVSVLHNAIVLKSYPQETASMNLSRESAARSDLSSATTSLLLSVSQTLVTSSWDLDINHLPSARKFKATSPRIRIAVSCFVIFYSRDEVDQRQMVPSFSPTAKSSPSGDSALDM
jgi:hypothetical protein